MDELLFTPSAVLDLLSQIDELKSVDVGIVETIPGGLQLSVGESVYEISTDKVTDIEVADKVVEEISDVNTQTYENLEDAGTVELSEPVESGIIKEVAKTLLVGGLVRLGAKVLKN